jgi:hypothetical protein
MAFWKFNTAPNGFIAWSSTHRKDAPVLAVGPIALHLPELVNSTGPQFGGAVERLRKDMQSHTALLQKRAAAPFGSDTRSKIEVLISPQEGDSMEWIAALAAKLPPNVFFWIRLHPSIRHQRLPAIPDLPPDRYDISLASEVSLSALLERVSVHVTQYSAVSIEAAACGVPTVATYRYADDAFQQDIPPSLFSYADSSQSAAERIAGFLREGRQTGWAASEDLSRIPDFLNRIR